MPKNNEPRHLYTESSEPYGKQYEEMFLKSLKRLGVPEVDHGVMTQDTRTKKGLAVTRATKEEDANGVDFWLYVPKDNKWHPIDLTTNSTDMAGTNRKRAKERKLGIKNLYINQRTLDLASIGGQVFLEEVSRAVKALFIDDNHE